MKKTWIKLMLPLTMLVGLVGCNKAQEVGHVKIGILVKNPATVQNQRFMTILKDYAADEKLDVEFEMSEAVESAEVERRVIETWSTAGFNGVISCVDSLDEEAKGALFKKEEIYFMNYNAPSDERIERYCGKDGNDYYLGGFGAQNTDVSSCYNAMKEMIGDATGEKSFVIGTAMKDSGVEMFVNRYNGCMQAINEWAAKPGNSIKGGAVKEIPGFAQAVAAPIATTMAEKPDFIFAEAGAEFWSAPMQEAKAGDANWHPKFGYVDSLSTYTYIEEGWADLLLCSNDDRIALAFAYLYNFCTGHKNVSPNTTEHKGKLVENIPLDKYTTANLAKAKTAASSKLYTVEQVETSIVRTNKNATFQIWKDLLYGNNA